MLYISDLDGTLLHPDGTLSRSTLEGLNQLLIRPDFHFTIATGRGYYSTRQKLIGLQLKLPVILNNGACITELATGKHLLVNAIAPKLVPELRDLLRRHRCTPLISANDGRQDHLYTDGHANAGMRWFYAECAQVKDSRLRAPSLYERGWSETITSLTIIESLSVVQRLYEEINANYASVLSFHYYENVYQRGWYWLEISSKEANKGHAIRQLCEMYAWHTTPLTVFGDNLNDIPMFEQASCKIAVANAHERVQQQATQVIGHCATDAVWDYLRRELLP
ncbi:MAG: HAD family hydrolase [Bacteroidota bacterium]